MCGIAGEQRRDGEPIDPEMLGRMADTMVHRGPDDAGVERRGPMGFGFRRLSIIDLSGGNQPLHDHEETVWVVGNGEIYNHRELRSELQAHGHRFATGSDIETIVHGYKQWGLGVFERLNGIFGTAIWDDRNQRLVLARDHLGVKPLYYHDDGRRLRFGSEIRPLTVDPTVPRRLDHDSLRIFLQLGYMPAPHTLIEGVRKLRPGHLLVSDGTGHEIRRYDHPTPVPQRQLSIDEATERYVELVNESVERQLISDVPVGMLLSGGVDSAMVLAAANRTTTEPIDTFTVAFGDDFRFDEGRQAAETAALFGGQHHEIRLGLDEFVDTFDRSLWALEEPVLSQSTFAYQLLTAEVRKHLKVVLTGQGADELWAGYDRYLGERYGAKARWLIGSPGVRAISDRLPGMTRLGRATQSLGESDPVRRFAAIHQVFGPDELDAAAIGPLADSDARATDVMAYWQAPVAHLDEFSQLLHLDVRMSLADDLLFYGDKLSMINSVEARVPLLDRELVSFVESLPPAHKLRGRTGKYLHKRAAERMLPAHVLDRPKYGFATPLEEWFAKELTDVVRRLVVTDDSWCRRHLDAGFLDGLISDHLAGRRNNRRPLSTLLSLEIVCRQQFDGQQPGHLTAELAAAGPISKTTEQRA